ncbi:MAG TPA: chromate transporter [Dongiaceae bacterium]|nr:chromate transporter [Dongiaceae bacterium]
MKTGLLGQLAITFATMSLGAIGGANAVLPEMHRQAVSVHGWLDDTTFANLFAIAQAAPGPNVIFVSLIGWHLAGPTGLAVATAAICLPSSLLTFGVSRIRRRLIGANWMKLLQLALMPIPLALMAASGLIMAQAADHTLLTVVLTAGTTLFVAFTQRNPLWALSVGGLLGGLDFLLTAG